MEWIYEDEPLLEAPDGYYGFIYLITNQLNGRQYIGRKFFTKAGTKQVKGKKKKIRKESDWKTYYGSSDELLKDIELHGKENFKREVLRLCKTLGETKYQETKYQFQNQVLESKLENGDYAFYNSNIMMKFMRRNIGNLDDSP